jgi:tetratricopeptide (TPR) repeat protein
VQEQGAVVVPAKVDAEAEVKVARERAQRRQATMRRALEAGMGREDVERLLFFEDARERAEDEWCKDPSDAHALTRWGGSLLELAHFRQGADAVEMIEEAVSKFEEALVINPRKHDALWCLGNAYTSQGFLFPSPEKAQTYFDRAAGCFEKALAEEPKNEVYKKALEMTTKAPGLHAELQRQLAQQQAQQQGAGAAGGAGAGKKVDAAAAEAARKEEEFYGWLGWGVLGVAAVLYTVGTNMLAAATAAPPRA